MDIAEACNANDIFTDDLPKTSDILGNTLLVYFRFSFRFFKKDSCQLLAKVCARSTG